MDYSVGRRHLFSTCIFELNEALTPIAAVRHLRRLSGWGEGNIFLPSRRSKNSVSGLHLTTTMCKWIIIKTRKSRQHSLGIWASSHFPSDKRQLSTEDSAHKFSVNCMIQVSVVRTFINRSSYFQQFWSWEKTDTLTFTNLSYQREYQQDQLHLFQWLPLQLHVPFATQWLYKSKCNRELPFYLFQVTICLIKCIGEVGREDVVKVNLSLCLTHWDSLVFNIIRAKSPHLYLISQKGTLKNYMFAHTKYTLIKNK